MKKMKLKRPYYIDGGGLVFRMPHEWTKTDVKRRYSAWPKDEADICQKCDAYIARLRDNPPHVTGWLSRGIDKARMLKIKREIEGRDRVV